MHGVIRQDHLHDVGKMMFGFNIFWTYVTFSQYFLIWYSNIPEETLWFAHHFGDSWETSFWILFGHFVFRFVSYFTERERHRNGYFLAHFGFF